MWAGAWGGLQPPVRAEAAESPASRVARLYAESQARFQRDISNAAAAWQYGRACFDWAELATNKTQRAAIAQQGIAACRQAIELDARSVAAHHYLGLNLGQLARTKRFSALGLLDDMEAAWHKAIELDPTFDHAGPHRSLGLLYRDAPGWPVSLGSNSKARRHLQKAVTLSPNYPDNQLNWLESLLGWGKKQTAQSQIRSVDAILAQARTQFTGDAWILSWEDWDRRWEKLKARVAVPELHSPSHQD